MAFDFQVTIDCAAPHALADWWAEALGWQRRAQDEAFIRRMVEPGHASEADTTQHRGALVWKVGAAIRHPGPGDAPRVLFQLVPEPKTVKNRVHLDVRVGRGGREAEVARLIGLGATVLHRGQQGPLQLGHHRRPGGQRVLRHLSPAQAEGPVRGSAAPARPRGRPCGRRPRAGPAAGALVPRPALGPVAGVLDELPGGEGARPHARRQRYLDLDRVDRLCCGHVLTLSPVAAFVHRQCQCGPEDPFPTAM